MKRLTLLPAFIFFACTEITLQSPSEVAGEIDGTNAFGAIRNLGGGQFEAYLCDGEGGEPSLQVWLKGERRGSEIQFIKETGETEEVSLSGQLTASSFIGTLLWDGVEHHVELNSTTRPDGLYDLPLDGARGGWIVLGDQERGSNAQLFTSNPVAFSDGALLKFRNTETGEVMSKSRFTQNSIVGLTGGSVLDLAGPMFVEMTFSQVNGYILEPGKYQATDQSTEVKATDQSTEIFNGTRLTSANDPSLSLALEVLPQLSSPNRVLFRVVPGNLGSLPLLDTFTVRVPNMTPDEFHVWNEGVVQSRILLPQ